MSFTLDELIPLTKKIEFLLEDKFAAEGTGLISKAESIKDFLSPKLLRDIKTIGRARNTLAHEDGGKIQDLDYQALFESIMEELNRMTVDTNFGEVKLELKRYDEIPSIGHVIGYSIREGFQMTLGFVFFAFLIWYFFSDGSFLYFGLGGLALGLYLSFDEFKKVNKRRKDTVAQFESGELEAEETWTFYSNRFQYKSIDQEESQTFKYASVIKCDLPANSCVLKIVTKDLGVTDELLIDLYNTSGEEYKNVAKAIFALIHKVTPDTSQAEKAA